MGENLADPVQVDANSIYDIVNELEQHTDNPSRWVGLRSPTTATLFADVTLNPYILDSGNDDFGAWVQLLGTGDTPRIAGNVYYDAHAILVTDVEQTTPYLIQFAWGADADVAYAAGDYTETMHQVAVGVIDPSPKEIRHPRLAVGTEFWARCWCSSNTGTFDFYLAIHEYSS